MYDYMLIFLFLFIYLFDKSNEIIMFIINFVKINITTIILLVYTYNLYIIGILDTFN